MKNLFKNLMLVAVAAMGFTACEQVIDDVNPSNEKFTVNIVGEFADDTRSGFDGKNDAGTGYKSAWDGNETVRFAIIPDTFEDTAKATYVDVENESEGDRATFAPTFDSNEGTIHAFSPKGVYSSTDASACKGGFTSNESNEITLKYENAYVVVPAEQTPCANSVDPAAHILAGKADFAENVNMTFNHVVAYGKMTIKNFAGAIDKVEITASEPLAGTSCYYYYAGDNEGKLTNTKDYTYTVTLNPKNVVDNVFWFGCAPVDLSEGTLTVKVYSGEDTYTKELDITGKTDKNGENIKFQFQQGHVASFGVDMTGIEADVKEEVVDPTQLAYKLVTDVNDLKVGDYVIIAAKAYNYALSTDQKSNNRGQCPITKSGDYAILGDDVQYLTLKEGTVDGTFAFYTGSGYLYAASSSANYLKTQTNNDANSSWTISITNGTASVVANGSNSRKVMQYNDSSSLFACYSSASQKAVAIYKGVDASGIVAEKLSSPEFDEDKFKLNAKSITLVWNEDKNAQKYVVSYDDVQKETTANEITISELEPEHEYTFSVTAIGDGVFYSDSDTVSVTASTIAENTTLVETTETLSFANKAQRTSFSTTQQIWEQNGIIFTNKKASSSTNVADYANPVRLYQGSSVTVDVEEGSISKIVFDCNSTTYANTVKTSMGTVSGASVEVSSDKVTVIFATPVESHTIATLNAQVRLDSISVTFLK